MSNNTPQFCRRRGGYPRRAYGLRAARTQVGRLITSERGTPTCAWIFLGYRCYPIIRLPLLVGSLFEREVTKNMIGCLDLRVAPVILNHHGKSIIDLGDPELK